MYLRTSEDELHGYGLAPAAAAKGVGTAVAAYSAVRDFFSTGGFKAQMDIVRYTPHPRPPGIQPAKCVRWFRIATYLSLPFAPNQKARENSFLFKLDYEYDGRNLLGVRILPQEKGSSTLYKSTFDITFAGKEHSLGDDPVAQIRYYISGTYERWDLISNSRYKMEGQLDVSANGSATLSLKSDDHQVRADAMTNTCQTLMPKVEIPKVPIVRPFQLIVYFHPAGSDRIRPADDEKIAKWFYGAPGSDGLRESVRGKIMSGTLPIILEGHASTTQPGPANRELSARRVMRVQRILEHVAGSGAKFQTYAHGEYKAGSPDKVEDPKERRVRIFVEDVEWR